MRHRSRVATAVGVVALQLLGCTERNGSQEGRSGIAVRDSGDVTITWNGDPSHDISTWFDGQPASVVGSGVSEVEYQLYGVAKLLPLPNGSLAVANSGMTQVLLFDSAGDLEWSVGRRGDGPGEFRAVSDLFVCGAENLVVDDLDRRVHVFDVEGEFMETVQVMGGLTRTPRTIEGVSSDCTTLLLAEREFPPSSTVGPARAEVRLSLVRIDGSGTVGAISLRGPEMVGWRRSSGEVGLVVRPFGSEPIWSFEGEELLVGQSDRAEFRRLHVPSLNVHGVVRWDVGAEPVSDDLWADVFRGPYEEFRREYPREAARLPEADVFPLPERLPITGSLFVDDRKRTWVARHPGVSGLLPGEEERPEVWWVFSPEGVWRAVARLPNGKQLKAVGSNRAFLLTRDSLGVERIEVFPLQEVR